MSIQKSKFMKVIGELKPLIGRIIGGLGVKPQSKWVYGMSYEELVSEALWILYFHILPGYKEEKGKFVNYAAVYLSRELRKRLYRSRKKKQNEMPYEYLAEKDHAMKSITPWEEDCLNEMQINRICGELSSIEMLLLRDVFSNGRFRPLRDMERLTGIDHVTLSRIRKGLVRKILDRL